MWPDFSYEFTCSGKDSKMKVPAMKSITPFTEIILSRLIKAILLCHEESKPFLQMRV